MLENIKTHAMANGVIVRGQEVPERVVLAVDAKRAGIGDLGVALICHAGHCQHVAQRESL